MDTIRHSTGAGTAATIDHRTGRSSIGAPVTAYRRVERQAPRPDFRARRAVAAGVLVVGLFVAAQAIGAVSAFFGSSPVLAEGGLDGSSITVQSFDTHVARAGDSLWSIADLHRGDIGRDDYLDGLVELNGGTSIQVGQAVLLP